MSCSNVSQAARRHDFRRHSQRFRPCASLWTGLRVAQGAQGHCRLKARPCPENKGRAIINRSARIIPGGQALLGFQFVATLTKSFESLPQEMKWLHFAALAAVALSVLLLMTPAAVHRLAFHGEDDPQFFQIGSRLVIAAALPLALGISADIAIVVYKITESGAVSAAIASAAAAVFVFAGIFIRYWREDLTDDAIEHPEQPAPAGPLEYARRRSSLWN